MRAVDGVAGACAEARAFRREDVASAAGAAAVDVETRAEIAGERFAMSDGNGRGQQQRTRY